MPNKSYQKGRRKEYKIKKALEEVGYIVLRTSGSHGFADLICIDKKIKIIRFIQCKPDKFSNKAKQRLLKEYEWLNDEFQILFQIE